MNETVHTIGQTFGIILIFVLMFLKKVKILDLDFYEFVIEFNQLFHFSFHYLHDYYCEMFIGIMLTVNRKSIFRP